MIIKLALAACVAASACAQAADTYTFPTYANGAAVDADCQRMLADLKQQEATLGAMQPEPVALWARMEAATPLGHVSGSRFPASFGHVATNYAAGYYSYLWSLVLAEDLRTAFAADKLDADVGSRYRRIILGNGGQVAAADLMQQFLGRASDSKAFFKSLNKQ